MSNRILVTDGRGQWSEESFAEPQLTYNSIIVESIYTGVCRSDIDMAQGTFALLPRDMMGHEGLGQVLAVGAGIDNVKIGDIVATRGEPAYADRYSAKADTFVVVPSADPKYILEPVACGINIVKQNNQWLRAKSGGRLALLGTGFLAQIVMRTLALDGHVFDVDVIGHHNRDKFYQLNSDLSGQYDVIVDLSSRTDYLAGSNIADNALIILAASKYISVDIGSLLWKNCTIQFPSPRNPDFIHSMTQARDWIENGSLQVDNFWTKSYNRDTHWRQAFIDAAERQPGYSRGYICWQ